MISAEQLNAVTERIVRVFGPEKVIVFGSYARGDAHEDSDVDFWWWPQRTCPCESAFPRFVTF